MSAVLPSPKTKKPYNAAAFKRVEKINEDIARAQRRRDAIIENLIKREASDPTEGELIRGARLRAAVECNGAVRFDKKLNGFDRAVYAYASLRRKEWRRPSRDTRRETKDGFFIDVRHLRETLADKRFTRPNGDKRPSEGYVYKSFDRLERFGYLRRGRESGTGRKHRGRVLYWLPRLTAAEDRHFAELTGSFDP